MYICVRVYNIYIIYIYRERERDSKGRAGESEEVYIGRGGGSLSNKQEMNLRPKYFFAGNRLVWEQAIGFKAVRGNRLVRQQSLGRAIAWMKASAWI